MKDRNLHRRLVTLAVHALAWVSICGHLGGCEGDRVAGTSVGTGNPGVVTLGFVEGSAAARVTGQVTVYAPDHNPLVDSLPLAAFAVDDQDSLELPWESLVSGRAGPISSSDSLFRLNILLRTLDGRGAWLPGVAFALRPDGIHSLFHGSRMDLPVVPLDFFRGAVEGEDGEGERRYLTLFGSPFFGRVNDRAFALDSIPRGRYEARLVRFLENAPIIGDTRPAPVHALGDSLDTQGTGALSPLPEILGTVPLPIEGPRDRP